MIVIVTLMATLYYPALIDTAVIRPEVRSNAIIIIITTA
jgi:hypothetical protein